ncbi:MAG: hypothetical protein HOD97_01470 [Candidatus Marinimicrobia bacterium]|jgi:hypothetical protein|nr:hypothetical protein [Candidatus Neomarinimicrobiota bacterium]MBT4280279.1 hypothetical protein [Candidatus Neomarinimicrobiota bacterium]MBT4570256.1 hypothetical protein [Candidatus Neomarinimicrobiota bacterium]MBT4795667.1 hypothetical protein [Candidatus Neomarinimicrobiota bacterium]MBT5339461.1 hypothetical protein [Candidatus Neomarinimicrobiota bacterium]
MLEGIICPVCEKTLEEVSLKESLSCKSCKVDLRDRKFLDFLEYLMTNGIVEDLDFFDANVYSEDIERLEPDDEEDVDPAEFEKRKDTFSLFENEVVQQKSREQEKEDKAIDYEEFKGIEEDWEEFNSRDFKNSK